MRTETILKYTDLSTPDHFLFVFRCDRCCADAFSERYIFNTKGFTTPLAGKARAFLWTRQHNEAYKRAKNEARTNFNLCPACGRWVCTQCFHVSSEDVTDICIDCRQEQEPVRQKLLRFKKPIIRWSGGRGEC